MATRSNPPLPTTTRAAAKALRASGTDAEQSLWYRLRAGRLLGLKFRRQHSVPPYVVDFACIAAKLIVELDGGQHEERSDAQRTEFLERQGFRVMRFWNNDVLTHMDAVLEAILGAVENRTLSLDPSPGGRGEKDEAIGRNVSSERCEVP